MAQRPRLTIEAPPEVNKLAQRIAIERSHQESRPISMSEAVIEALQDYAKKVLGVRK